MSMHEQDRWQCEGENECKLKEMKRNAIQESDVITYNAISLYENSGNDVTVLIKVIKTLYDTSNMKVQRPTTIDLKEVKDLMNRLNG